MNSKLRSSPPNLQFPARAMRSTPCFTGRFLALFTLLLGLVWGAGEALAADSNPPKFISYQGRLYGADNKPLAEGTNASYGVIFKIYKHETSLAAAQLLWAEEQTVTVSDGYFSVLLGQGGEVSDLSDKHGGLDTLFKGANASDRFIGITVKSLPGTTADAEIAPRLRLLASPFAFLAHRANLLVKPDGADGVTVDSTGKVAVTELQAADKVTALSIHGNGSALTALNAANISSGSLNADRISTVAASKITGDKTLPDGVLSDNVAKLAAPQIFTGPKAFASPVTVNAALTVNARISAPDNTVTAKKFVGNGTIPIGGIIMWSGAIADIPSGWALCDGGDNTPDLRSKFIIGAGRVNTYPVGNEGGASEVQLSIDNMPNHKHTYDDHVMWVNDSKISGRDLHSADALGTAKGIGANTTDNTNDRVLVHKGRSTSSVGGGTAFSILPPYYALAFIMRVE